MNVTNSGYYTTDYLKTKPVGKPKTEEQLRRERSETLVYYDPEADQPKVYYDRYYKHPTRQISKESSIYNESGWSIPYPDSIPDVNHYAPSIAHPSPVFQYNSPPRFTESPPRPIVPQNKQRIKVKIRPSKEDPSLFQAHFESPYTRQLNHKESFTSSNLIAEKKPVSPRTYKKMFLSTKPSLATIQPNENYQYDIDDDYDDDNYTNGMLLAPAPYLYHKTSSSTIQKVSSKSVSEDDLHDNAKSISSSINELSRMESEQSSFVENSNIVQHVSGGESESDDPDYLESEMLPIELNLLGGQKRKKLKNLYSDYYQKRDYDGPTHFKPTHFRQVFEDEAQSNYNPIEFVFTEESNENNGTFRKLFRKLKMEKEDPDSDEETRAIEAAKIDERRQRKIQKKEERKAARLAKEKADKAERIAKARAAGRPVKVVKKIVKKKAVSGATVGTATVAAVASSAASKAPSKAISKAISKTPSKAVSKATTKTSSKGASLPAGSVSVGVVADEISIPTDPRPPTVNYVDKELSEEIVPEAAVISSPHSKEESTKEIQESSDVISIAKSFAKSIAKSMSRAPSVPSSPNSVAQSEAKSAGVREIDDVDVSEEIPLSNPVNTSVATNTVPSAPKKDFHPIWNYILSWIVYDQPDQASASGERSISQQPATIPSQDITQDREIDQLDEVIDEPSQKQPLTIKQLKEKTRNTIAMLKQPASVLFDKNAAVPTGRKSTIPTAASSPKSRGISKKSSRYTMVPEPISENYINPDVEYEFEFDESYGEPPEQLFRNAITGEIERYIPEVYNDYDEEFYQNQRAIPPMSRPRSRQTLQSPVTVGMDSSRSIPDSDFYEINANKPLLSNVTNLIKQIGILRVAFSPIDALALQFPNLQTFITVLEIIIFCWILYELSLVIDAFCVAVKAMCAPIIAVGKLMNRMV